MINSIQDAFKDFYQFIKAPADTQDTNQSNSHKGKRLFILLVIEITLVRLLLCFFPLFEKWGWYIEDKHKITQSIKDSPIWEIVLFTIIIHPFIEEIIFRLFLKYKRNYVLKGIAYLVKPREHNSQNIILNFWNRFYFLFFYVSAILFAMIHINNYDAETTLNYTFPILILPQFIAALFIGYLRVRYNFMLGYLMHALHNAFFITIALLINTNPKLDIDNQEYTLKVEEASEGKEQRINNSIEFNGTESLQTKYGTQLNESDEIIEHLNITDIRE